MTGSLLLDCVLIALARIADVSLGTLRTVSVIHGRRATAWSLGFVEVLIWVLVVSAVIGQVQQNLAYGIAYALGFATGNYIGITIEQYFAYGHQVLRVFTRQGPQMCSQLRDDGLRVTSFDGEGRDGPVQMLFIETQRKTAKEILRKARSIDPTCFYIVDDIRVASASKPGAGSMPELTKALKRK
ncbi:MAG TPA: DUF5698 domain-containing protein [Phycisphaerales bacterium]|nr:DUF5698 domain-containing protein [Phycisphaerales bacterium]HMP36781.1 DUF5698 domain-containing protein [Phycisphaerales bacterium]